MPESKTVNLTNRIDLESSRLDYSQGILELAAYNEIILPLMPLKE